MNRIFLDIGAHTGETLAEVRKSHFNFDRIICFEPSPRCFAELEAQAAGDPRIVICPYGLADGRQRLILHGSGQDSATTLLSPFDSDHNGVAPASSIANTAGFACPTFCQDTVLLEDASDWVRQHLDPEDLIVAKLNCEGGEVAILRSWIRSGAMAMFYSVMITFDIRNFPTLRHQEAELRGQLRRLGLSNVCFADDVMRGPSHGERLAHWLGLFGLDQSSLASLADYRAAYAIPLARFARRRGRRHRLEHKLKQQLGYAFLPTPAKAVLRSLKARLGLSAERV